MTGAGRLGRDLAEQASNYGAKIVAVHDAIHPAAQKMAADHPGATAVENLTELFEGDLDGLIVTTPPPREIGACEAGHRAGRASFHRKASRDDHGGRLSVSGSYRRLRGDDSLGIQSAL
ncbi:hypothetical protein QQ054_14130 [Oscillatoria amoena NRMC-F 0135]|nr:hypothetical protein [Oscillatoria amoena NRMC-F 0135]